MFAGSRIVQGHVLVVVDHERDAAAVKAAEVFLRTACSPGGASIAAPSKISQARNEVGRVVVFCTDVSKYFAIDMQLLADCLSKLRPGGHLVAHLGGLAEADALELSTTGLFAGATDSKISDQTFAAGGTVTLTFSCFKPSWAAGAAAALPGMVSVPVALTIDEDELLGEVPAAQGKGKSDCSTAPKACANCSCGRKELEEEHGADQAKMILEKGTERSACGSCYLGDAFRCATCPYRGLPAFKGGTKVELTDGESGGTGQFDMKGEREEIIGTQGGRVVLVN